MRKRGLWQYSRYALIALLVFIGSSTPVFAEISSSSNYQTTQTQFGSNSFEQSCSGEYCARVSIGDLSGGSSQSGGSKATFGEIVDSDPFLEVIVDPGTSNLGELSTETTGTKTTIVRIRNYLSSGYQLQIIGDSPKINGHTLATLGAPAASDAGTEQFGMNVADNSTPDIGAAPVQVPDDQISFGEVTDDYKTPNLFKYSSGDVVAQSLSESGRTDYTISMIVNISNSTPAGHYTSDFSAVVIPIF